MDGLGGGQGAMEVEVPDIITDRMAFFSFFYHTFPAAFTVLYDSSAAPQNWGRKGLENIKVVIKNMLDTCLRRHVRTLCSRKDTVVWLRFGIRVYNKGL